MVDLTVYYDFASPFCYVAVEIARRLRLAGDVRLQWMPFEVIDYLPARGAMPQNPAFVRRREASETAKLAEAYGLTIHLRERLLNSNLALCAVEHAKHLAEVTDGKEIVERLHGALFDAYYRDGLDISDLATVLDVAASAGAADDLEGALGDRRYRRQVGLSRESAHAIGVTAVPTWLANGFAIMGIPGYAEFERLIESARNASA
jgi:predicted DsbA family dithiol-disulfide isomerase